MESAEQRNSKLSFGSGTLHWSVWAQSRTHLPNQQTNQQTSEFLYIASEYFIQFHSEIQEFSSINSCFSTLLQSLENIIYN